MRNQITTKISEEVIKNIDLISKNYEITRSQYIEIASTLSILDTAYRLSDDDLNLIIASLITKSSCSICRKVNSRTNWSMQCSKL
ncbi:hypothetical protein JCM1393_12890 [Clostridium carnis]